MSQLPGSSGLVVIASSARLPTVRAYGIALSHLEKALHQLGYGTIVAAPLLESPGIPPVDIDLSNWAWRLGRRIQTLRPLAALGTWGTRLGSSWALRRRCRSLTAQVLWTRSPEMLLAGQKVAAKHILELHHVPSRVEMLLIRKASRRLGSRLTVVAISARIAAGLEGSGIKPGEVVVEPSGVGEDFFLPPKEWPTGGTAIQFLHSGTLSTGSVDHGAQMFVELAHHLRLARIPFVIRIVGANVSQIRALEKLRRELRVPSNQFVVEGHCSPDVVPRMLEQSDILLAHYPEGVASRHESPLKLIEYAAACRPILASATPSVEGTLPPTAYVPFAEGNLSSLLSAIDSLISDPRLRLTVTRAALAWAQDRTWMRRAARILSTSEAISH